MRKRAARVCRVLLPSHRARASATHVSIRRGICRSTRFYIRVYVCASSFSSKRVWIYAREGASERAETLPSPRTNVCVCVCVYRYRCSAARARSFFSFSLSPLFRARTSLRDSSALTKLTRSSSCRCTRSSWGRAAPGASCSHC